MRKTLVIMLVAAMTLLAVGCAITDYSGRAGEQTEGSAKLWGKEVAFTGTGIGLDGTYAYTVSYNRAHGADKVTIDTLFNPGVISFSREGLVDRDGDDVQGRSGTGGGKFIKWWTAVDPTPGGTCEFQTPAPGNITFNKPKIVPPIGLCITAPIEEVDKDLALQAEFSSLDSLIGQIWSGALSGSFTMELNGIRLNGVRYPVDSFSIGARTSPLRPARFTVDLEQPATAGLIQTILENTEHGVPYAVGLTFEGGMSVNAPSIVRVAFDHDVLASLP